MARQASTSEPVLAAEIFAKTRRIEIRTSRLVNELFGGRYLSTFKGRGIHFVDVREYVAGDDVRNIHWNVTARLNHPYVKRFTEERELTILIAVDVSASNIFGTRRRLKSELVAELVSLLAFSSVKNNDKVGLLLFSDRMEKYIPPRKSRHHALRLVREALGFTPVSDRTDIAASLDYLNRIQKKRCVLFLISDFIDEGWERALRTTHRRHDTIAFCVEDPMEKAWPPVRQLLIRDPESGLRLMIPGGERDRTAAHAAALRHQDRRDRLFARLGIDRVVFRTDQDYVKPMLAFFQERARRYR